MVNQTSITSLNIALPKMKKKRPLAQYGKPTEIWILTDEIRVLS